VTAEDQLVCRHQACTGEVGQFGDDAGRWGAMTQSGGSGDGRGGDRSPGSEQPDPNATSHPLLLTLNGHGR